MTRVFADPMFMRDALRLAVVLDREVEAVLSVRKQRVTPWRVAHIGKVRSAAELRTVTWYVKEAYRIRA